MKTLLILSLLFVLTACGGDLQNADGLTPFPVKKDLPDSKLKEAVSHFLSIREAPANSTYDIARVDLNNDGLKDGIVLFKTPHTYWCGWDGCGMVIFKSGDKKFTSLSAFSGARGPIYVSNTTSNGWRDVIIRISGSNMADKNVMMSFNGFRYPNSPLLAPDYNGPIRSSNLQKFFN